MTFSSYERLALFATVLLSVATVAATNEIQPVFWGLALAAVCLRIWLRKPPLQSATLPTVLLVSYGLFDLYFIAPNILVGVVDIVLLLLAVRVLSGVRVADNLQLLGLSFLLMLGSSVLTVEAIFGVFLLVYMFTGLAALVLQNLRGHWEAAGGEAEALGNRRGVLGRAFAVAIAALGAGILVFTLVLYFAFPRVGIRLWNTSMNLNNRVSGFSDTVRLNDVGRIQENPAIAVRVQYSDGIPAAASPLRRLRGVVLESFDGFVWRDARQNYLPVRARRFFPEWRLRDGIKEQTLKMTPSGGYASVVFLPNNALALRGEFVSVLHSANGNLNVERAPGASLNYEVDLGHPAAGASSQPTDINLAVPANIGDRTKALASEWGAGYEGEALARRLTAKLRAEFKYSMELADIQTASPIEKFLFETKAGHCELFATSLAMLLRTRGVPTRVINGFNEGEDWDDNSVVFRDLHAHSWVEAYFPETGWIELDPTPASPRTLSWERQLLRTYYDLVAEAQFFWGEWFVAYDFTRQAEVARNFQAASDRVGKNLSPQNFKGWLRNLSAAGSPFQRIALAAMLILVAAVLGGRWYRRRAQTISLHRATRLYVTRMKAAEKVIPRSKGQTPLQFAVEIATREPAWRDFADYTACYYKLRYGNADPADGVRFLELHDRIPARKGAVQAAEGV